MRRLLVAAVALAATGALTGCGSGSDDAAVERARHFRQALQDEDAAAACADLAPRARTALEDAQSRPCTQVILDQDLPDARPHTATRVYGSMAQVSFEDDTVFLSHYRNGWRVTGVGCAPTTGDVPHECTVEVG